MYLPRTKKDKSTHRRNLIALGILLILGVTLFAQENRRVLLQKERLKRQIVKTEDMLESTRAKQESSYKYLLGVRSIISDRENFLSRLDKEILLINDTLETMRLSIAEMETEINRLKGDFGKLLYEGLKAKNRQVFFNEVLSAADLREAYQKMRLLEKLAAYRKAQLNLIRDKQRVSRNRVEVLMDRKQNRSAMLRIKSQELRALERNRVHEKEALLALKGKEKGILEELKSKKKQLTQLEREIADAIASGGVDTSDQEHIQKVYTNLRPYFKENKGILPWPAADYIIANRFGRSQHPEFKDVKTENNGIDLLLSPGEKINVVFDGTVKRVMQIPGLGKTILIKHDRFYTVYANLEIIFVDTNSELATGDVIGRMAGGDELQEFHFEVWEGTKKRNPELWLNSK